MVTKKKDFDNVPLKPITGSALLKRISELGEMDIEDKARLCGYYHTSNKLGIKRADVKTFYEKFIEANNLKSALGGRSSDVIHVTKNSVLVIPSAFVHEAGAVAGDKFEINVDRDGSIRLIPINVPQ